VIQLRLCEEVSGVQFVSGDCAKLRTEHCAFLVQPMSHTLYTRPWFAFTAALSTAALLFAGSNSQQRASQNPATSAGKVDAYFPPRAIDGFGDYLSGFLGSIGEPSLFAASQNPGVISYRLTWLSAQHGYVVAIRLSLNTDGRGEIKSTVQAPKPDVLQRTQLTVSAADVKRFLQMVEDAKFWAMPAMEQENPDPHRRPYKLDASPSVFEGVRNGTYHVVFRQGLEPSPFTQMVHFLAKDLARLDKPTISQASH
jgi:hypothetical protein